MKAVGIDIGYGYSKGVDGATSIVFPSIVGPAEDLDFDPGLATDSKGLSVEVGGKTYFVGDRAALQSRWTSGTLSRDRATTDEAKVLLLAALGKLLPNGYVNGGLSIVTGLPIAWLDDREALTESWVGSHKIRLNSNRSKTQFDVGQVEVVPQAWGTLVREMVNPDGKSIKDRSLFEGDVVVIDFGNLTINFLSFSQREYIQRESDSLDDGMSRVLAVLQRGIRTTYGLDLSLHQTDAALRQGAVRVYGEVKPIHDLIKPTIEDITDAAVAQARSLWDDGRSKTHVLLTGGGAIILGKRFKEKYGHPQVRIAHDAQMANAQGLYLWALMKEHFRA